MIRTAVDVIPAAPQTVWRTPAVANFALGGLGAGFYVAAAVAVRLQSAPVLTIAAWLGPALVLAGFAAVATEAGRPLRGHRVLARLRTSWMSRELALGGLFAVLAALEFVTPHAGLRALTVAVALALAAAQGAIVRSARGVAAWDVAIMPIVFLASALVSGLGLLLLVDAASGAAAAPECVVAVAITLPPALMVWLGYLTYSDERAFVEATRLLREGRPCIALAGVGYFVPWCAAMLALALPMPVAVAVLAGALMVAGQLYTKWLLIRAVGSLRPITVGHLTFHRRAT
jgi:DMSO reductase anchor subunit